MHGFSHLSSGWVCRRRACSPPGRSSLSASDLGKPRVEALGSCMKVLQRNFSARVRANRAARCLPTSILGGGVAARAARRARAPPPAAAAAAATCAWTARRCAFSACCCSCRSASATRGGRAREYRGGGRARHEARPACVPFGATSAPLVPAGDALSSRCDAPRPVAISRSSAPPLLAPPLSTGPCAPYHPCALLTAVSARRPHRRRLVPPCTS